MGGKKLVWLERADEEGETIMMPVGAGEVSAFEFVGWWRTDGKGT